MTRIRTFEDRDTKTMVKKMGNKKRKENQRGGEKRREKGRGKNEGRLLNVIKCNATRRVPLLGTLSIT